ncbi:MAG: FtsW/RodA/SpoVE family cell cycle protein, partial [candidate division WOR-3 bacterium]
MPTLNLNIKENLPILIVCLILLTIGLVTIYNVTNQVYFLRQLIWIIIATLGLVIVYQISMPVLENIAWYLGIVNFVLLLAVLFFGHGAGARRWFSFGWINFQPSEFAKLSVILMLASYFKNKNLEFNFKRLFIPVAIVILFTFLIVLEPDLGTALIFLPILAVMLFWSGLPISKIFILFSPLLSFICGFSLYLWIPFFIALSILAFRKLTIAGWLIAIIVNIIAGLSSPIIWAHLKEYQKARIIGFLSPWLDPKGMSW